MATQEKREHKPRKAGRKKRPAVKMKLNKTQLIAAIASVLAIVFCILWVTTLQKLPQGKESLGNVAYTPLMGKTVIVDAGHGGADPGMTGISGRLEKEVNLEISRKLRNLLEQHGAEVIMTRQTDDWLGNSKEEDFQQREAIIAGAGADLFLTIHCNSFEDQQASGPQVFYIARGSAGKPLAEMIQAAMNEELKPAEPRKALDTPYRLLKTGSQPSCTIECGFMSNPQEEALLQRPEYQQRVAQSILDGVIHYMKEYN